MESFLVRPREPTVLANSEYYELLSTDLHISSNANTVHVVPGPIDVERFNDALARTLSLYPLAAGRIEKPSSSDLPWKIRLTNSAVPVTVIDSNETKLFPNDTIVQSPLHFVQSVNAKNVMKASPDEPLLKVTLTRFILLGQTAIGVSSSHGIGDGFTACKFLRLLSQNYQGCQPLDAAPCYRPLLKQPLISHLSDNLKVSLPTSNDEPSKDLSKGSLLVPVTLRFTAAQLCAIRQGVLNELYKIGDPNPGFSRADIVIALLAHSITQADENSPPVDRIMMIVNHRGMGVAHNDAACNAVICESSEPPPQSHDKSAKHAVLAVAIQVRRLLTSFRDVNILSGFVARQAALMKLPGYIEVATQAIIPGPGCMTINSLWRFDWTSAHFGYPNQTKFYHTNFTAPRYVKIFTPNPTLSPDGKKWDVHRGDAELSFFLFEDVKERFERILQDNASDLGMPGKVESV